MGFNLLQSPATSFWDIQCYKHHSPNALQCKYPERSCNEPYILMPPQFHTFQKEHPENYSQLKRSKVTGFFFNSTRNLDDLPAELQSNI